MYRKPILQNFESIFYAKKFSEFQISQYLFYNHNELNYFIFNFLK